MPHQRSLGGSDPSVQPNARKGAVLGEGEVVLVHLCQDAVPVQGPGLGDILQLLVMRGHQPVLRQSAVSPRRAGPSGRPITDEPALEEVLLLEMAVGSAEGPCLACGLVEDRRHRSLGPRISIPCLDEVLTAPD